MYPLSCLHLLSLSCIHLLPWMHLLSSLHLLSCLHMLSWMHLLSWVHLLSCLYLPWVHLLCCYCLYIGYLKGASVIGYQTLGLSNKIMITKNKLRRLNPQQLHQLA